MMLETSSVVFGTTTIHYSVRRTARRKTVSIAVDPDDGVVLAAPKHIPIERLDRVVRTKAKWIVTAVKTTSDRPPPMHAREFVSGETFLYAGRQHTLRVVVGGEAGAALEHGRLVVRVPSHLDARPDRIRSLLEAWYRARAHDRVPVLVETWTTRTNLHPSRISFASQQRRWGSCSPSGELRFNWRIVGAGKRLIEYVVAHELMHLEYPDHTPAFWRALERVMPDYEARRAQLRETGPRLVW